MIGFLLKATKGYRLRPWKSPYLLWRVETYWGLPAGRISSAEFIRFAWGHRADFWRFLRWQGRMTARTRV
jgi:hypothetical protein